MRQAEGQGSCAGQDIFSPNHQFMGLCWLVPALPNHASFFPSLPLPSPFSCLSFLSFFPPLSSPLSSVFLSLTFHLSSPLDRLRVGALLSGKHHPCLHKGPFPGGH